MASSERKVARHSTSRIPDEVLFDEILVRLPVLSLIQLAASKSWCKGTICNPKFMAARRRHHQETMNSNSGRVFELYDKHAKIHQYMYDHELKSVSSKTTQIELPARLLDYSERNVVGSCDGLLCFLIRPQLHTTIDPYNEKILLWDLTLGRTTLTLPTSYDYSTYKESYPDVQRIYGIGYNDNSSSPDYNVIRASLFHCPSPSDTKVVLNIYSLASNVWKTLDVTLCNVVLRAEPEGVCINNVMYWLYSDYKRAVIDRKNYCYSLLAFSLAKEEFDYIPLTEEVISEEYADINIRAVEVAGERKLCLFTGNMLHTATTLWVMVETGVTISWTKLFNVDVGTHLAGYVDVKGNDHALLAKHGGELFMYNHRSGRDVCIIEGTQVYVARSPRQHVDSF